MVIPAKNVTPYSDTGRESKAHSAISAPSAVNPYSITSRVPACDSDC